MAVGSTTRGSRSVPPMWLSRTPAKVLSPTSLRPDDAAVVIAQPRPYDEQAATAEVLRRHRLATVARGWPDGRAWPGLISHALAS